MKIISMEQPSKKMELYILGDLHYPRGKRNKFLKVVKEIKENENAYVIGLGDYCECIGPNDPRYNPEEIKSMVDEHGSIVNMMDEQWEMFEKDIKPITNKIIGLHMGNHESKFARKGHNELKNICKRNKITFLDEGHVIHEIKYKNDRVLIQTFHGTGAGTTIGSTYNKLDSYSLIADDVDIIAAGHCFDEKTELLTKDGWKKHDEIKIGDKALTYNLDTGNSEWNVIQELYKYDHYKKLIHFKNRVADLMVTQDHSIVGSWRYGRSKFRRIEAKHYLDKRVDMPCGGNNNQKDYKKYSDDEIKLIAWIITEGCYEDGSGYVRISQSEKPKVGIKHITDICEKLGLEYRVSERSGNEERNYPAYRITVPKCLTLKKIIDNFPDKQLTRELLKLSSRQFNMFFKEVILGDGSRTNERCFQYSSKYEQEADIMQELCAMNRFRSSKTKQHNKIYNVDKYTVSINTRGVSSIDGVSSNYVDYDGIAWCPSVKNQTVVVRRNGKVVVSGNSHKLGLNITADRLKVTPDGLKSKTQYHCSCGSFLGNYSEDSVSYSEIKSYRPLPIGYIKIIIDRGEITEVKAIPV